MPVCEVGREQIQAFEVGGLDRIEQWSGLLDKFRTPALDAGADAEQVGRGALRVEVPQQRPPIVPRRQVGEIHGGSRLTNAALEVV
jgi:hypothetical protein